jgi:ATP-binding cassette subfamily C (CFTR/MRP) protein 1
LELDAEALKSALVKAEGQAGLARQTGDSAVHGYHAKSAGWKAPIIFLASVALFAFCDAFPNLWLK